MKNCKRLLLFPFAGLYEILLLAIAGLSTLGVIVSDLVNKYSTKLAQNMLDRAEKLPSLPWYIGK